jgi:ubiquinone/menaquinone biosynthesis methyltransferase
MNKKISTIIKMKNYNLQDPSSKKYFNRFLFTEVAPKYNFITKALSFGRDKSWKKELIKRLPYKSKAACLDVACGTGDIAFLLAKKFKDGEITGIDLNDKMLTIAKNLLEFTNVSFKEADMCKTGFATDRFDYITGGYALRNAPDIKTALQEFYRILKVGGTAIFLDFSKSNFFILRTIQIFLLNLWGSFWGLVAHGNPDIYAYIAKSLDLFPNKKEFSALLKSIGFVNEKRKTLFFGFVSLISFEK